jgi:hypothetical protein
MASASDTDRLARLRTLAYNSRGVSFAADKNKRFQ